MKKTSVMLAALFAVFSHAHAQISGAVFKDFNGNGTKDTYEPFAGGVIVKAYNSSDVLVATGTTTAPLTGTTNYSITPPAYPVRLEFSVPSSSGTYCINPSYDFVALGGINYGSNTRFVTATTTTANFAIYNPNEYALSTNPYIYNIRQYNGDPIASTSGTATTRPGIEASPYLANLSSPGTTSPAQKTLAISYIGNCYGIAYAKQSGKLFTSATVRRHSGLGTLGSGGIYMVDSSLNTSSVVNFYDLDANGYKTRTNAVSGAPSFGSGNSYTVTNDTVISYLGTTDPVSGYPLGMGVIGSNSSRGLTNSATSPNNDPSAYGQPGIFGLGDLDISDDGTTLYSVNLYDRKVYLLTLNSASNPTSVSSVASYSLPNPPLRNTVSGYGSVAGYNSTNFYDGTKGLLRPYALKYYRGKLYVGAVTTGEFGGATTTDNNSGTPEYTDLWAYVFEFDPATNTFNSTPVIQFPLNFNRGTNGDNYNETFQPWRTTSFKTFSTFSSAKRMFYAQAILSDIAFDPADNSMILGFRDRVGDQIGHFNYRLSGTGTEVATAVGEILRAYKTSSCVFELESAGKEGTSSSKAATSGASNGQGPGGGEFYYQDHIYNGPSGSFNQSYHINVTEGALITLAGTGDVGTTTMDPANIWQQGVDWFSNSTGADSRNHAIEVSSSSAIGYSGKGNGLGDMEIISYTPPVEVGNRVWNDANNNGIQDAGEVGIANVTVSIYSNGVDGIPGNTDDVLLGTTTTKSGGEYYFTSASGTDVTGIDYGVNLSANTAYNIRIGTADWTAGASSGTGDLSGYKLTKINITGNGFADWSDNDAVGSSTTTPMITLTTGALGVVNHNLDFGFFVPASVGDKVWLDNGVGGGTANDGLQNGTEPGVSGINVTLYDSTGAMIGATVTDAYGKYLFSDLAPGNYTVGFTLPPNYTFTTQTNTADDGNTTGSGATSSSINGSDVNVYTGKTYTIVLSAGENNLNIDAGLIYNTPSVLNSIGDKVWFDTDGDGTQDAGEPGVSGVTVVLYASDGTTVVAITTTDANGNYIFNNLPANTNYIVGFTAPAGTILSPNVGGTTVANNSTNSDPDPTTGKTTTVNTGTAGNQITGIDAGIKNDTKGALGDFVWNDINKNGIQDTNEPGIAGVTLKLYDAGSDGKVGGGDDVLLTSTVSDVTGHYIFNQLDPGKYFVVADPVSGYTITTKDAGTNDLKDNDFATNANYSGKFVSPVYQIQNVSGGVTRDMSVDIGFYNSTNNLNSIGDYVWNDLDQDGIQDGGEPAVANVTVRLLNALGNAVNNPSTGLPYVVTTNASGYYRFSDLADGSYIVEFANLPTGYAFTVKDASGSGNAGSGTDGTTDSDPDVISGRTSVIDLDATSSISTSVNITNVDAGIHEGIAAGLASIGDKVWFDVNSNGIQDSDEPGVSGVTVELLDGSGNAIDPDGAGALTQTLTVTDALGNYLFGGLNAGGYKIKFSNLPVGYQIASQNSGSNDAVDSDGDNGGVTITGSTTSLTSVYTLAIGDDNLTVDLGVVPASGTNTLGDFVWFDINNDGIQNVGEQGVRGVTVSLLNSDGTQYDKDVTTAGIQPYVVSTDINGLYKFVGLPDGVYKVQFSNLPAGFTFTTADATTESLGTDSDADATTGITGTYDLDNAGASSTAVDEAKVDAGIISTRAVLGDKVWLDADGDGVQDAGEAGISGVTVTLYASDGTTILATAVTDANGNYLFTNLSAGSYVVGFGTLPNGLEYTQQNSAGDNGNNTNSDANPSTGQSSVIVLSAGEVDLTVDAGVRPVPVASVGDFVWNDINNDGIQGATEPGVPGILVTLYDGSNNVVGVAITNGSGGYLISNLDPASGYYIEFSNLPNTATFTLQTSNVSPSDATLGSDANQANGKTAAFSLSAYQYLPTIDAGIRGVQVLPVRLLQFAATPQNNSYVKTDWTVGEEFNVNKYELERSANGTSFTTIGFIDQKGSGKYYFNDLKPNSGVNYYRLKIVNNDGVTSYSDIRRVVWGKVTNVSVYPNPSKGIVYVTLKDNMINQRVTFTMLSADGKIMSHKSVINANQTEQLDLSALPLGNYLIKLTSSGETIIRPVMVVK